jgi:hypothetical protein
MNDAVDDAMRGCECLYSSLREKGGGRYVMMCVVAGEERDGWKESVENVMRKNGMNDIDFMALTPPHRSC